MRSFMIFLPTNYFLGDQIKEDAIGSAYGMHRGEEIFIQGSDGEN
jgi:hypothetical protein